MFYLKDGKFFLIINSIMLLEHNYLLSHVEAVNGVIWSKNESDFVEIFSIQSFEKINKQRLSISRDLETHDFNGITLKFTSFAIDKLVTFVPNDTTVSGVHGDMWQVLGEMSNFKIHGIKINEYEYGTRSENGSWSGLLGYIYRNETDIVPRNVIAPSRLSALDFTLASWTTGYRFYMKEQLHYHKTWMAELFTQKLWVSVVGLFFALTFANFFIHILNFENENSRDSVNNLRDHFFYIFSIFCNQGWTPQQFEKRSKILLISIRLFAWLIVIAFSSKLISLIAQRKNNAPFNDLQSLYKNTDYKLIVQPNSYSYSIFATSNDSTFKNIVDAGRLTPYDPINAEKKICTGKYVYLEIQDVMDARVSNKICKIIFVGKSYFDTGISAGLVRGFKYRKTIDLGILKLHEFGIINRMKSKWLDKPISISADENTTLSIKLGHVSLIFVMLFVSVVLSLVILLIENIFHKSRMNNLRKR